ncbi:MAG: hypothetical protein H7268_09375 [Sandarakinorhabdus sp.]|nr:hypothetical protein [Sandarakinorhabdus sp.]
MKHAPLALLLVVAGCAAAPPPKPAAAPPPPPPPPGLGRLIGQSAAGVTALLGAASLDRSEGPARQMQFIRPPCVLDVFLYPATSGAVVVRTAAARKPDGSRMDPGTCLGLIVPARPF